MGLRRRVLKHWMMGLAGFTLACAARIVAEIPAVVEWHRTTLFPFLAPLLQRATSSWSSTLGEMGAGILALLVLGALGFWRTRILGALALIFGLAVFTFYAFWGLSYRYPRLASRLPAFREAGERVSPQLGDLAALSARMLARAYEELGPAMASDGQFLRQINGGLTEGFGALPAFLDVSPVGRIRFGPFKLSRASFALTRLQLSGYYFPWSGEAQINAQMPRTLWSRVGAHEKAHQRGFARENEATVIGTLACLASSDPTVFYSGALGLFVGLDRDLNHVDPEARRRLWIALPQRVAADLRTESAFWKAHEGVAGAVSERVNDTYLKAQGVTSGVGSYSETTQLVMQAIHGGLIDFTPREKPR